MKVYRKQMKDIKTGEIVAGRAEGWWTITKVTIDPPPLNSVALRGINTSNGKQGFLTGNAEDWRDLAG